MQAITLHVDLARRAGALLRMLALVERRGYSLVRITTEQLLGAAGDDATSRAELVVFGPPPIDRLARHLEGLVDVRAVHVPAPPPS